jgi:hypothetical protein
LLVFGCWLGPKTNNQQPKTKARHQPGFQRA